MEKRRPSSLPAFKPKVQPFLESDVSQTFFCLKCISISDEHMIEIEKEPLVYPGALFPCTIVFFLSVSAKFSRERFGSC